jgi:hypothetical protein
MKGRTGEMLFRYRGGTLRTATWLEELAPVVSFASPKSRILACPRSVKIVRISPHTGKILGWIDLSGLMDKSQLTDADAIPNGIAYDAKGDRLFVTGKMWPKLFAIKIVHQLSGSREKTHRHPSR